MDEMAETYLIQPQEIGRIPQERFQYGRTKDHLFPDCIRFGEEAPDLVKLMIYWVEQKCLEFRLLPGCRRTVFPLRTLTHTPPAR